MKRIGLTLGKYAPLHNGHQYIINTALEDTDELYIVIYDAKETNIPLPVRANWLRTIYPEAKVIEAWNGPTKDGITPDIALEHNVYLKSILKDIKVTHFYSAEPYGEHVSKFLMAEDVRLTRNVVPISGTQIRNNPFKYKNFVDPIVYKDMIMKIVFLGAPSTGKSTIAEKAAEHFNTVWMPEYGREYWEAHQINKRLTELQLAEIAAGHLVREEALIEKANKYMFVDTNALTTRMFSLYYHGWAGYNLNSMANDCRDRYDLVFLCSTDIPYEDTPDRSGEVHRFVFQKQIIADLAMRKIPYFILEGSITERLEKVVDIVSRHKKYENVLGIHNN